MKLFSAILLASLCLASSFTTEQDLKRSKRDFGDIMGSVKSGLKSVGSAISDFAVEGYEETKNLFSSDRKFGDYRANQFNVRFGEDSSEINSAHEQTTDNVKVSSTEHLKTKREINEFSVPAEELNQANLDEINKKRSTSESTTPASE